LLLAMAHGHPSLSTVHHHDAHTAWKKLAQYLGLGAAKVDFAVAGSIIADAVDFFVHVGFGRNGLRAVTEIVEVVGWDGEQLLLNRVFVPDPATGRAVPRPSLSDARRRRLVDAGFNASLLLNPAGWWTS